METLHPCEMLYEVSAQNAQYGNTPGVCRITGKQSTGIPFAQWVKKTFNDHDHLKPGTIISNAAAFCFDEASEIIQQKTGKDKLQRFRTYSHILHDSVHYCVTKADKRAIYNYIISGAELVCLTDSGQKHVLFKHRLGFWQLDDMHIQPNIELFQHIHSTMTELLNIGFTQTSILQADYNPNFIAKNGFETWRKNEQILKEFRGTGMFDFAGWMLFKD